MRSRVDRRREHALCARSLLVGVGALCFLAFSTFVFLTLDLSTPAGTFRDKQPESSSVPLLQDESRAMSAASGFPLPPEGSDRDQLAQTIVELDDRLRIGSTEYATKYSEFLKANPDAAKWSEFTRTKEGERRAWLSSSEAREFRDWLNGGINPVPAAEFQRRLDLVARARKAIALQQISTVLNDSETKGLISWWGQEQQSVLEVPLYIKFGQHSWNNFDPNILPTSDVWPALLNSDSESRDAFMTKYANSAGLVTPEELPPGAVSFLQKLTYLQILQAAGMSRVRSDMPPELIRLGDRNTEMQIQREAKIRALPDFNTP